MYGVEDRAVRPYKKLKVEDNGTDLSEGSSNVKISGSNKSGIGEYMKSSPSNGNGTPAIGTGDTIDLTLGNNFLFGAIFISAFGC